MCGVEDESVVPRTRTQVQLGAVERWEERSEIRDMRERREMRGSDVLIPCCTGERYDYELQHKDYRVAAEGE